MSLTISGLSQYHCESRRLQNCIKGAGITLMVVGILALLGAGIGFMAAHGIIPQHIASHLTFFSSHKWTLLTIGGGGVLTGIAGMLVGYFLKKLQERAFKSEIKKHEETIAQNAKTTSGQARNPTSDNINYLQMKATTLFQRPGVTPKHYFAFGQGEQTQVSHKVIEMIFQGTIPYQCFTEVSSTITAPEEFYSITTFSSEGFTIHYYQNVTDFNRAIAVLENAP